VSLASEYGRRRPKDLSVRVDEPGNTNEILFFVTAEGQLQIENYPFSASHALRIARWIIDTFSDNPATAKTWGQPPQSVAGGLSTREEAILRALRRSPRGASRPAITGLTGLKRWVRDRALLRLQDAGLVRLERKRVHLVKKTTEGKS